MFRHQEEIKTKTHSQRILSPHLLSIQIAPLPHKTTTCSNPPAEEETLGSQAMEEEDHGILTLPHQVRFINRIRAGILIDVGRCRLSMGHHPVTENPEAEVAEVVKLPWTGEVSDSFNLRENSFFWLWVFLIIYNFFVIRPLGPPPRDETVKKDLMDFQPSYGLGNSDNIQNRRLSGPQNVSQHHPMNHVMPQGQGSGPSQRMNAQNGSIPSPPTTTPRTNINQKTEKEKVVPPGPAADSSFAKVEKIEKSQSPQTPAASEGPTSKSIESPEVVGEFCSEEKHVTVASPAPSETRSDTKSIDSTDSKKPFTFNVNAKEFNPTAKSFTPVSSLGLFYDLNSVRLVEEPY